MSKKMKGAIALLILGTAAILVYKLMMTKIERSASSHVELEIDNQQDSPGADDLRSVKISIASSNTKEDWLGQVTAAFNDASSKKGVYQIDQRPINVEIIKELVDGKQKDYRSGTMINDTLSGKITPTILSPGSQSWIAKFNKEWKARHNFLPIRKPAPILVRTPIVIAMWRSRAKTLGCYPESGPDCSWEMIRNLAIDPKGWAKYNRPEWGRFTFGYGAFGESNSGTLGVLSMCMVGSGKRQGLTLDDVESESGCGHFVGAIERAKVHSGKSDVWLLEKMIAGGQNYLNGVITYESNVIAMNRKHGDRLPEPLVAFYPQDGTVFVGHPFAILDAVPWVTPDQAAAAKIYGDYLLEKEQQEAVLSLGLRPSDDAIKLGAPIDSANGADPEVNLTELEVPDTLVMDRIGEVWRSVKKKAVVVIAFDKSGSMSEHGKIGAARSGAKEFVAFMGLEDILIWMPFDAKVYTGKTEGPKYKVGENLIEEINSISAGGETALYDTILAAMEKLMQYRKNYGGAMRYGLIVLSDGKDTAKGSSLAKVEAMLTPRESDPSGVQIHTVCIGQDCDEPVLRKVANAAHGRFWKGRTEKDMIKIYHNIATHY
jgi:Ca-activated chloride channel family protein